MDGIIPALIKALINPFPTLFSSPSVTRVDSATLSLMVPLLSRGLLEKLTTIKQPNDAPPHKTAISHCPPVITPRTPLLRERTRTITPAFSSLPVQAPLLHERTHPAHCLPKSTINTSFANAHTPTRAPYTLSTHFFLAWHMKPGPSPISSVLCYHS
jgi:hypothetical protein